MVVKLRPTLVAMQEVLDVLEPNDPRSLDAIVPMLEGGESVGGTPSVAAPQQDTTLYAEERGESTLTLTPLSCCDGSASHPGAGVRDRCRDGPRGVTRRRGA